MHTKTPHIPFLVFSALMSLDFEVTHFSEKKQANGPDMWIKRKSRRPLSLEVKKVAKKKNGTWQVPPVSPPRKKDDLIAIVCGGYVLVEPMKDHLLACGPRGYRQLTVLLG